MPSKQPSPSDYLPTPTASVVTQIWSGTVSSTVNLDGHAAPRDEVPTFNQFLDTWQREMAPQWRRLHAQGVHEIVDKHLMPALGRYRVNTITKANVLALRSHLAGMPGQRGKTLSASRINKIMTILGQCLTEAADRWGFPSPCKGVKRLKARRPDIVPFSLDEVERICQAIRPDFRAYVTCRFYTGMRTGEINGLKWEHIDLERGLILVREVFSGGEAEENAKSDASLRDIPILPVVRGALRAQLVTRRTDTPYVFHSSHGNPIDAHNFANRVWYPLLARLHIAKRRPYQTRHTTATLLLAAGENPEWIARFMGHASTQMLFTVYSRYVPNLTRQDGTAIADLLRHRGQDNGFASQSGMPSSNATPAQPHSSAR